MKHALKRIVSLVLVTILVINMIPPITASAATALDAAKLPSGLTGSYEGSTADSRTVTWTPSVTDNVYSISGTAKAGSKRLLKVFFNR